MHESCVARRQCLIPPPYSVPLPFVSLIGVATCLLSEGEVNRLGDQCISVITEFIYLQTTMSYFLFGLSVSLFVCPILPMVPLAI